MQHSFYETYFHETLAMSDAHTPPPDAATQLAWQAYCYLTDELSPAARVEFEARLEHEQAARETLGCLVQLTSAVQVLKSHPVPVVLAAEESAVVTTAQGARQNGLNATGASQARTSWVSWIGWGVAAALGGVLLAQAWQPNTTEIRSLAATTTPAVPVQSSSVPSGAVASSPLAYAGVPPVLESTWLGDDTPDEGVLSSELLDGNDELQVGIPAWMLSAVSPAKTGLESVLPE